MGIFAYQRLDAETDLDEHLPQVSRFTQAVKSYTGRYYDTLLASATTTAPVIVTPAMLKNTGFLEQGFSETTIDGQLIPLR
ncbi:shufflon protein [Enterobacter cloacae]|uniref:Shufflon protein n=1 Tax=Enterobacter cloacae TaxID=550 RepID=A0A377M9D6_ENTCL|nr:shufflon protein [Enterobacter cloacae]